ncbi:MAG: nucleoside:proton symporter [Alphaproteobacteria bacterium]|nr:nucleoside:proton symporter [Alphaproteobacteria bacterium]
MASCSRWTSGGRALDWDHWRAGLGIGVILLVAWLFSENRRAFPVRIVASGIAIQVSLALVLLTWPPARAGLFRLNAVVDALTHATRAGTGFVFGYVGGAAAPFTVTDPQGLTSFAFTILPMVIVISALAALLWYWRILAVVVHALSYALRKIMGIGGAVGLGAAATIFIGMVEAPLLIRPYLGKLSRNELFILCTVGLATVAGTVFVLYATIVGPVVPGALGHILVASMLSLPGAIVIASIMIPPDAPATGAHVAEGFTYHSSMDAIARGTEDGLRMWLSIVAMLLVIVALVHLTDIVLKTLPDVAGTPLSMERIFGWAFSPFAYVIGIPWHEARTAGALMGDKTVLNEFIAYVDMAQLPQGVLDPRVRLILLYALCGFANFGSVGIMIAGLSTMIPERRQELVSLAMRALVSGTLASAMSGALIGFLPLGS